MTFTGNYCLIGLPKVCVSNRALSVNTWSACPKVFWLIVFSLIQGEEFGINSQNIATFADSKDTSIRRFLGIDEKLGEDMGLPNDFAQRVLKQVGNYGEIYECEIGKTLQLDRCLNNLWTKGGLLYSPPFR
jgi:general L-amino acid transport system substrate-binding protein